MRIGPRRGQAGTVTVLAALGALAARAPAAGAAQPATTPTRPTDAVLVLVEHDLDGDTHDVAAGTAIVDINSRIAIAVDRGALLAGLARLGSGARTAALLDDYVQLQRSTAAFAKALSERLPSLAPARRPATPEARQAARKAANDALGRVATLALPLLDYANPGGGGGGDAARAARRLRFRNALDASLELAAGQSIANRYLALRAAATHELERLQQDLGAALATEGVKVMLGAWIVTGAGNVPLHLPGFDDYADQPRYEVERFRLVFTDEQQKQFQAAKEFAARINAGGGQDLARELASNFVEGALAATLRQLQELEAAARAFADEARTAGPKVAQGGKDLASRVAAERAWLEDTVGALTKTAAGGPAGLWPLLAAATPEALQRGRQIAADAEALVSAAGAAGAAARASADRLAKAAKGVRAALEQDLAGDWEQVRAVAVGLQINADTLAFGDKVRRFDVDALPVQADLDIELAGQRADGDQIVIKVGSARAEARVTDLEAHYLVLRRVLLHVETAVGLIFAIPVNPTPGENSAFQAAPAYAAFLKKGLRCCSFWNNLLAPGLGLSVSALDFNRDGVPEMGIAAAASVLRDWLQGGFGYNLIEQRWYGFVGVGLPLPMFGLSVSNAKTPK